MAPALLACIALHGLALAIVASSGWIGVAFSPVTWWIIAAVAYTIIPAVGGLARPDLPADALAVLVSPDAVDEYVLFVGVSTLCMAIGWRSGFRSPGFGGCLSAALPVNVGRVVALVWAAIALRIGATALSGIDPREVLTTVNSGGYSFYDQATFRYSAVVSLAAPVIRYGPVLIVYGCLNPTSLALRAIGCCTYLGVFLLTVLSGARTGLILFVVSTLLAFIAHPWARRLSRRYWALIAPIGMAAIAAMYPLSQWMQSQRSLAGRGTWGGGGSSDVLEFFNLVTPSAALFDWVSAWGHAWGVSLVDVARQAPPAFLVPQNDRPEFLQIVDALNVAGSGAAVTSPAEIYVNSGWIAGPVTVFFVGLLLGSIQSRVAAKQGLLALTLLLVVGPTFAAIFTRGYLWQSIFQLLVASVAAVVLARAGSQSPPASPRNAPKSGRSIHA